MKNIKVSIITVCYQSAQTLEHCIKSVLSQKYKNIQYIIIDGDSNDDSKKILDKYRKLVSRIIIERDDGIYDAMNKGISMSSGEIIGFLNSDDFFSSNNVISSIVDYICDNNLDGCYGDVCYVDRIKPDLIRRRWKSSNYVEGSFSVGWAPPHPTFYVKKYFYDKYGAFNLSYSIAADFELMLRFIEINKINVKHLSKNLVNMRLGGISNRSLVNILKQNLEIIKSIKSFHLPLNPLKFMFNKIVNKLKQYK
tara:strand:+ start:12704 stop:13459 length:756 start_codon:yes stop_codon:yes gene_type:complete